MIIIIIICNVCIINDIINNDIIINNVLMCMWNININV